MQKILEDFLELVQIDSDSLGERQMADALTAKFKALGCDVWEDTALAEKIGGTAGNLYITLEGTCPGSVFFSSHMDRVQNGRGIKPVIEGDRVVSQGTILAADDLSGISSILDGIRRVQQSGKPHPRVEVVLTVAEETSMAGSRNMDYTRLTAPIGYVLDSPGHVGRVIKAAPSEIIIEFEVTGKTAHAGNAPEQGISAVMAAAKALVQLPHGRIDFETTSNFSVLQANTPTNVVTDYAKVRGEARSHCPEKLDRFVATMNEVFDRVAAETGAGFKLKTDMCYECFRVEDDSECIRRIKRVFDKMGIEMNAEAGGGGMDANHINKHGHVCVGVATGYFRNHTSQEYLEIADLLRAGEMVEQLIYEWVEA